MSTENVRKYFEVLNSDSEAQEFLKNCPKPETKEEALNVHIKLAEKLGFSLSEEELNAYLEETEKAVADRTEAAAAAIEELSDEEAAMVAGGKDHPACKDTFKNQENCWYNDACDIIVHKYDNYQCHYNWNGTCYAPASCDYGNYRG